MGTTYSTTLLTQEKRYANPRHKVKRQQYNKFGNLAEREWSVDGRFSRLAKALDGVIQRVFGDGTVLADEVTVPSMNEDGVEDINLGFVLPFVNAIAMAC